MYPEELEKIVAKIEQKQPTQNLSQAFSGTKLPDHELEIYVREVPEFVNTLIDYSAICVRVPLEKFSLAGINTNPRILRIHDGSSRRGQPPSARNAQFRGLRLIEGLWLVALFPDLLKSHSIDLVASIYSIECVPTLYYWNGVIYLSAICPDISDSMCGAPYVIEERPIG